MRYPACVFLLFTLLVTPALAQSETGENHRPAQDPAPPVFAADRVTEENSGIELLKAAEAESAALDGEMRAWLLWQIGMAYQTIDRTKALELFDDAFTAARAAREDRSAAKSRPDPLARITGRPTLSSGSQMQADIARSILLLEPKRSDQLLRQVDPAVRSAVLVSVLAHEEKEHHFDLALETLNRIAAQDEMPYEGAMRLMDTLKPEQSGELMRLFSAALASYRDHPRTRRLETHSRSCCRATGTDCPGRS